MTRNSSHRIKQAEMEVKEILQFQIPTSTASFSASNQGVWFLKNQGNKSIFLNILGNTATSLDLELSAGDSLDTEMFLNVSQTVQMIANEATQTVSGWVYNYTN